MEGAPRSAENRESLGEWRKVRDAAPEAVEKLLVEEGFDTQSKLEQMETLRKLIAVYGAMHEGTQTPVHNEHRFMVELLARKLNTLETEEMASYPEAMVA